MARFVIPVMILMLLGVAGCESANYQPAEEIGEQDDLQDGPGLFSGEDGVFTIFSGGGKTGGEQPADGPVKVERRRR